MASIIKLKRSSTQSSIPGSLDTGEIAVNLFDRRLYVGNGAGVTAVGGESFKLTVDEGTTSGDGAYLKLLGETTPSTNSVLLQAGEGIDITLQGNGSILFAGEDATTSNKGVASFDSGDFSVSSGAVSLADSATGAVIAISATANETTVSRSNGTVTIGLPDDVTVTGQLNVGENIVATGNTSVGQNASVTGTLGVTGVSSLGNTGITGTLDVSGLSSLDGGIDVDGAFTVADTSGNINTSGALNVGGSTTAQALTTNGTLLSNNTTDATSSTSGSAQFKGGVGVAKKLYVGTDLNVSGDATIDGNLTVEGAVTYISSSTVNVDDSMLKLSANNSGDTVDTGVYGKYVVSGNSAVQYAGYFRDAGDGVFKFYTGLDVEPSTTVDTTDTGYGLAQLDAIIDGGTY
jgi:hypothetical protein